ncbi:hypothetical protein HC251_13210 [Iamia sp. SCSIO 61187]|uniref:hypothetical protein n=1 Tax=Iamia sp. SCSIO 61187 TaxID=2722752 RepID=UPI001C62E745|nr:hypothetical protein [Iamia sp. SCSIO 61187]QYG93284.1 hypothetical protein HC251_13210 [Iamia sp. SCSIO 61187]
MADTRVAGRVPPVWLFALMVANSVAAIGLFGDIARHVTFGFTVGESDFLSSWHLVLYGGVAGVALVLGAFALVHGPRAPLTLLRSACAGLAALTAGGIADSVWHDAFGIEASFQALVSPPHLLVFAGLVLLMATPIGVVADGPSVPLDVLRSVILALSVTSLLVVISLFTGYLTPLIGGSRFQAGAYLEPLVGTSYLDYDTSRGLAQTLWFGVLVSLVVVLVRARSAPVSGTWTVAFGLLGVAPLVASGRDALPLTIALFVYGLVSDLGGTHQQPHPLATGTAVAAMWAAMFATIEAVGRQELVWVKELWGGAIATGFLVGLAVGGAVRWVTSPARVASRVDIGR